MTLGIRFQYMNFGGTQAFRPSPTLPGHSEMSLIGHHVPTQNWRHIVSVLKGKGGKWMSLNANLGDNSGTLF